MVTLTSGSENVKWLIDPSSIETGVPNPEVNSVVSVVLLEE